MDRIKQWTEASCTAAIARHPRVPRSVHEEYWASVARVLSDQPLRDDNDNNEHRVELTPEEIDRKMIAAFLSDDAIQK